MSLYLMIMRQTDLPDELRYHDYPLRVGQAVDVDGKLWIVAEAQDTDGRVLHPSGTPLNARYICHPED